MVTEQGEVTHGSAFFPLQKARHKGFFKAKEVIAIDHLTKGCFSWEHEGGSKKKIRENATKTFFYETGEKETSVPRGATKETSRDYRVFEGSVKEKNEALSSSPLNKNLSVPVSHT